MLSFSLFLLAPLAVLALPTLNAAPRKVHEARRSLPFSWSPAAKPHPSTPVPLRIGLTQSNLDLAHDELMRVSDPASPHFGKHWSAAEVANFFAPSNETIDAVLRWLEDEGISRDQIKQSQSLGWLEVSGVTVSDAERLLNTDYTLFEHGASGDIHLGCGSYSLPEHVSSHVDFITPTLHFDAKVNRRGKKRDVVSGTGKSVGRPGSTGSLPKAGGKLSTIINELENCDESIVPLCLQTLYKIPFDLQFATSKNSYGIVEYTPQSYLPTDLDMFFEEFLPQAVGHRPTMDSIDGGQLQTTYESFDYNGESNLDLEYSMSLVYPLTPVLYQVGDMVEGGSFNNFLDALDASYCTYEGGDDPTQDGTYPDMYPGGYEGPENCGGFPAAHVISTSYGYNEIDLTPYYEERQCNEYLKLGLQGVTVLYASGDSGVAGETDAGFVCLTPDGQWSENGTVFAPQFPPTCPYVTGVGATQVKPNATVFEPEEACETVIYSSGGFSNVFPMPSYQAATVKEWYAKYPPPYTAAQYNNSMTVRAFPDMSANGANYVIAIDGEFEYVYGTSASSPVVGSVFALINDARLAIGKGPIGFVNPSLYANPGMFNDITTGGNQGCGTPGFESVPGWDPVTGLGTPDYVKMVAYYLTLP